MPVLLQTTLLLICSNVFMTFAWYAHLKDMSGRPGIRHIPPGDCADGIDKTEPGAGDVRWRHHATGRFACWLAAGLWWCVAAVATADDPPQPYLEEPHYEMAPHLVGGPDGFRERLADAGVTILADNTGFYIGNTNGGFA